MPIDTRLDGNPGQIFSTAGWLRSQLAFEVQSSTDTLRTAIADAADTWRGSAGVAFSGRMSRAGALATTLNSEVSSTAGAFTDFAGRLASAQAGMAAARAVAAAGGLPVVGTMISEPLNPASPDYPRQVAAYQAAAGQAAGARAEMAAAVAAIRARQAASHGVPVIRSSDVARTGGSMKLGAAAGAGAGAVAGRLGGGAAKGAGDGDGARTGMGSAAGAGAAGLAGAAGAAVGGSGGTGAAVSAAVGGLAAGVGAAAVEGTGAGLSGAAGGAPKPNGEADGAIRPNSESGGAPKSHGEAAGSIMPNDEARAGAREADRNGDASQVTPGKPAEHGPAPEANGSISEKPANGGEQGNSGRESISDDPGSPNKPAAGDDSSAQEEARTSINEA
jgi:uncharacterized protein YukE